MKETIEQVQLHVRNICVRICRKSYNILIQCHKQKITRYNILATTHVTDATPTESDSSLSPVTASIENITSYSHLPDNTHLAGSQIISLEKLHT